MDEKNPPTTIDESRSSELEIQEIEMEEVSGGAPNCGSCTACGGACAIEPPVG